MKIASVDYQNSNAPSLFAKSLHETGFGIVTNHPINYARIQKLYALWQDFFASEEKENYLFDKEVQDGYFPPSISETAKGYDLKDLKEYYQIYPYGRCPEFLKQETMSIYDDLTQMGLELLKWIDDNTPPEVKKHFTELLPDMMRGTTKNMLRVIHYPPLSGTEENGAIRAAAHEDINLLTLLVAATTTGLQVKDRHGKWHDVSCDPNSIIVNIGDMLQEASQGYYPSTTHQVVNPPSSANVSRLSIPLFLHPRNDVVLSERYVAIDYLNERLRELGVK